SAKRHRNRHNASGCGRPRQNEDISLPGVPAEASMMAALELLDKELQPGITDSERLEFFYGGDDVVATGARPAVALPYKVKLLGKAEAPGILAVTTINDIAKGVHALLGVVLEPDPAPRLAVDPSDLL